jgi:hypothetical protein
MKLDSKYFDRIRIKPPEPEMAGRGEPVCEWQDCGRPGSYRAPKGRMREGQYFHFCLDHVRDYNKSYNYFAGMAPDAIDAYQKASVTGHRPTWRMGVNGAEKGQRAERPGGAWSAGMNDMFGVFGGFRASGAAEEQAGEPRRPTRQLERKSFAMLDLEGGESRAEIKARYKELVKRLHPDANGGDRSTEDRLREIIQAYNHLKAAGFC